MGIAAFVGVTSATMAVGLHILGFCYNENAVTAMFIVAGTCGLLVTIIGALAYCILGVGMQRGNDQAMSF